MTQQAKPVVKNKFWIVEEDGRKVGTIQAAPDGVVFVHGQSREKFPTLKVLSLRRNIHFSKTARTKKSSVNSIYDFPCDGLVYNPIYDVKSRLPLYTKKAKSKSFYCAGYYLVNIDNEWITVFCPKKIILSRNKYLGPFTTRECANQYLNQQIDQ